MKLMLPGFLSPCWLAIETVARVMMKADLLQEPEFHYFTKKVTPAFITTYSNGTLNHLIHSSQELPPGNPTKLIPVNPGRPNKDCLVTVESSLLHLLTKLSGFASVSFISLHDPDANSCTLPWRLPL